MRTTATIQQRGQEIEEFLANWRAIADRGNYADRLLPKQEAPEKVIARRDAVIARYACLIVLLLVWGIAVPPLTWSLTKYGFAATANAICAALATHWVLCGIALSFVIVGVWGSWELRRDQ